MLHRPISRFLLFGVVGLSMATPTSSASADVYFETAYLPTSSVIGLSPSILSTSYVVPTAYSTSYLPTSYLSTSSVVSSESVVYPTSTTVLRRSLLRPRRYVERTYYTSPLISTSYSLPTSYALPTTYLSSSSLLPTTYLSTSSLLPTAYVTRSFVSPTSYVIDDGVITTSASSASYPCETTSSSPPRATASRPSNSNAGEGSTITSVPSSGGVSSERRPQATLNSSPAGEEAPSSAVKPNEIPEPVKTPVGKQETPPPAPALPELDPNAIKVPEPGKSGGTTPQPGETSYRSARRPNYDGRNILRGRVISAESRRPEEGVAVIISNVTKAYSDRPAMTDADGEFKVSLPDGDWTVKVKMPSGSVYAVGRDYVTASGGRITDPAGRNVADFLITR